MHAGDSQSMMQKYQLLKNYKTQDFSDQLGKTSPLTMLRIPAFIRGEYFTSFPNIGFGKSFLLFEDFVYFRVHTLFLSASLGILYEG